MGAARTRRPKGWVGRRYHLDGNKEVFDAGTYAIFRALKILYQGQKGGRCCTIFADSTAAIDRVGTGAIGPVQQWARAAIEVCSRVMSRDNQVTILWVPAHSGIAGNEEAGRLAKGAAEE